MVPGKGIVVVNVPRELVSRAVSVLIDEELANDEHVLTDFACELSNMIAGQAKKAVDHMGFQLGHPTVIETEQIDTLYPPEAGSRCGPLSDGDRSPCRLFWLCRSVGRDYRFRTTK